MRTTFNRIGHESEDPGSGRCPIALVIGLFFLLHGPLRAVDNPVSYEDGINDCDVIKYNGEYFITGNWLGGDMFRSRNLTDWGQRTHIFSWDNTWHVRRNANSDMDIHGTHIAYDNGVFHLYAHLDTPSGNPIGIVHAVSDSVLGPYTEPVDAPLATGTIDAKTFRDEDGSLHYYGTRFGGVSGNHNDYRRMSDYATFAGDWKTLIWPTGGWEINPERPEFDYGPTINEGSFVFKYRGTYYMLYNANHTGDTSYAIGCATADTPDGFTNAGKLPDPVLNKTAYTAPDGTYEIYTLGQPWVVDGLNGFEKWVGCFAIDGRETHEGRTQRIDRVHFFDRTLYVDGPTNRYTPGYHPGPAEPQLRALFERPDGPLPPADWVQTSPNNTAANWLVSNNQAMQTDQSGFAFNLVNRDPAAHYLFEANLKMTAPRDSEDKAGVVAYYKDDNHWVIIGLDRSLGYGGDNWYCHVVNGSDSRVVAAGRFDGRLDYSVYHKIRVERNGSVFRVWIDDVLPPGFTDIETGITAPGVPGLYTDHTAAAFDGVIYTIGWDEYDERITGWGDGHNGNTQTGTWTRAADGLATTGGTIYKGDPMETYEFSVQLYRDGAAEGHMGVLAAAVDADNFLRAAFDVAADTFSVTGKLRGQSIPAQSIPVTDKPDYNLRVVKLADRVLFFVDGRQVMTRDLSFPASQVGLWADGMHARFNGILVYQTEPASLPPRWQIADVGSVGFEGSAACSEGTFTVNGSGSDIWRVNDGFRFVYQDLYGDGEITARVVSNDITNWWNKAALMLRDGLDSSAAMAVVTLCGGGNLQLLWRSAPGQYAQGIDAPNPPYPQGVWLRLRRSGSTVTAYYSYNGVGWTLIGSRNLPFSGPRLQVGLAVTSHDNSRLNGAVFDRLTVTGCTPGDYPADLNRDCRIDLADLQRLADRWLDAVPPDTPADLDNSLTVTLADYALLAADWLTSYDNQ